MCDVSRQQAGLYLPLRKNAALGYLDFACPTRLKGRKKRHNPNISVAAHPT